jgi:nucleotide-binding universal stress UspA family protein
MSKNVILVPTNFSSRANIAYRQSINFAERTNGDVYLLHVIPLRSRRENLDLEIDVIQNQVLNLLDEYGSNIRRKVHTRIEYGPVNQTIVKVEKEIEPDFLFIGSDAARNDHNKSITLKLIDKISCPLVVFAGRFDKVGCEKIVLPVDLTKETKQKVDLAVKIAKIYASKVYAVSATGSHDKELLKQLEEKMGEVKAIFDKLQIECETLLLQTEANVESMANAVNDFADDINASAIIIMTHQETKLQKFFVGSMATELIKKANVPIVCVSPKDLNNK